MAETRLDKLEEIIDDEQAKIGDRIHALLLLLRSRNAKEENHEDQSPDDKEGVEMEVGTESLTQVQVPVSNLEPGLRINNASPTDCEDSQCVVGFDGLFGHEEAMLQVSDVQARAVVLTKSTSVTNNQIEHQLFDKMPSKEKRVKHLKGWSFKFKRKSLIGIKLQIEQYKLMERRRRRYNKFSTNIKDESMRVLSAGNHRRMVRQLHMQCKRRMTNDSWNMRWLTLKVMKSHRKHKWKSKQLQIASNFWINHPQELVELVLRTALMEHDTSLLRVDWGTRNLAPFIMQSIVVQEMVSMQDHETITKTYSGQLHELHDTTGATNTKQELSYWSVAKHVKRDAHKSFGSKGLAYNGCVILEMNFAGFERGKTELLAFIHMKVIETRYAIQGRDEMLEVARDVSKRSMLGLTFGIRETNAGEDQRAVCEHIIKVNVQIYQISLVLQQVMRRKKIKFPKRWMFKYKYGNESIQGLQIQLRYKSWLEFEERFKSWRKHKTMQLQGILHMLFVRIRPESQEMLRKVKLLLKNNLVITGSWRWFMMVKGCHMLEHASMEAERHCYQGCEQHVEKLHSFIGVVGEVLFHHSLGFSNRLHRQDLQDMQPLFTLGEVKFQIKHKWKFKGKGREVREELSYLTSRETIQEVSSHYFLLVAAYWTTLMLFGSKSNLVWHRWKMRLRKKLHGSSS